MQDVEYDIAVVTVSTNKLDDACLSSLKRAMDASPLRIGFVLVDNGSTELDAYARATRHIPESVVLLRHANHGFGRSCNHGANEVAARYYFFLNPDTRIDDDTIFDRLHAFMQSHPRTGIVAPKIRYMDGETQETCRRFPLWYTPIAQRMSVLSEEHRQWHQAQFLMEDYDHESYRMVDWVQGSALMISGELFHELGGFDDRYFMYYEDVDLCRQCWTRGRPVYYLTDVELYHEYGKGSVAQGSVVRSLLSNRLLRAHIASWIKYTWKWKGQQL